MTAYDPTNIRVIPFFRPPTTAGGGWWRFEWTIQFQASDAQRVPFPHLIAPVIDSGASLVVGMMLSAASEVRIEALSRNEKMESYEIAYVSQLMHQLERNFGELVIDGYKNHPILSASVARSE